MQISIQPNPAHDFIELLNLPQADYDYQIVNIQGRQVLSDQINNDRIDVSILTDGLYLISVTDRIGSIIASSKFVKNKYFYLLLLVD